MASIKFCLFDISVNEHHELPQFHCDNHVPNLLTGDTWNKFISPTLFVTLFGRLETGESIAVIINNWRFHFLVELTEEQASHSKLEALVSSFRFRLRGAQFEFVRRYRAIGFDAATNGTRKRFPFLKVSLGSFRDGYIAKKFFTEASFPVHEADTFSSTHRSIFIFGQLMEYLSTKDNTCSYFSWIEVRDAVILRGRDAHYTHCTHETVIRFEQLVGTESSTSIPPMRVLSYDIECYSPRDDVFPEATTCPVIAIGNSVFVFDPCGTSTIARRICFSFKPDMAPGAPVKSTELNPDGSEYELWIYASELNMLEAWRDFVVRGDFDIFTGYNIWKFDVPYLMDRVQTLATTGSRFFRLGKILKFMVKTKSQTSSSSAMGDNDIWLFNAPGLAEIDVYMLAKRRKGMVSLKLKDVATLEVGFTKIDLPYTEINVAFRNHETVRIAGYCIRDTELPIMLLQKWGSLNEFIAVSRATYTPILALSSGGQQVKVRNMYFQAGHAMGFVFNSRVFPEGEYQGAIVITPKPGYYLCPVATLDYNSLYPSCMIKDNICPSTIIMDSSIPSDAVKLMEHHFVQHEAGIVPTMLRNLLEARSIAKKQLAQAKRNGAPDFEQVQLDHRQLALKLCANSTYGFFNTPGVYKCMAVAESTTCSGRLAIERAKEIAEAEPFCCDVIYGDTDSIMVRIPNALGSGALVEASAVAKRIAVAVTQSYGGKLILEPEKVYQPYLLAKKKRYAGLMYTNPNDKPKLDYKGFEIVRRDSFPLCHYLQKNLFDILISPVSGDVAGGIVAEERRARVFTLLQEILNQILERRVELSDIVISKSLKRNYANEDSIVQAVVNNQIKTMTPGREFPAGDRVPFLIMNGDVVMQRDKEPLLRSRSTNIAKRAVFVGFVELYAIFKENIDWVYYVERLQPTVLQLMEFVSPSKMPLITGLFGDTVAKLRRTMRTFCNTSHRDIDSFFMVTGSTVVTGFSEPSVRVDLVTAGDFCKNKNPSLLPKKRKSPVSKLPAAKVTRNIMSFFGKK